jgi:hypothetical protein
MKEKTTIEPGDNVLIDGVIWAEVEEVAEGLNGEEFLVCIDDCGGRFVVFPESVLLAKDL